LIEGEIETSGNILSRRDAMGISEDGSLSIRANKDSDVLILEVPMQA